MLFLAITLTSVSCKKDEVPEPDVVEMEVEAEPVIEENEDDEVSSLAFIEIPDASFKAILIANEDINIDGDFEISEAEAAAFTGKITADNAGIESVEGLQYFTNIFRLALFNNDLTSIDVSQNTKLEQLLLEDNDLTSIDISALAVLTDFKAHSNDIVEANVANGNNVNMWRMQLQGNPGLQCIKADAMTAPNNDWLYGSGASLNVECD